MPVLKLTDIPQKQPVPGCHMRAVHGEGMTVTYWDLDRGAVIPDHSHPHEQISSVIEGDIEITLEGQPHRLQRGCVLVIAPNSRHSVTALEKSCVIDVFHPVREDYR